MLVVFVSNRFSYPKCALPSKPKGSLSVNLSRFRQKNIRHRPDGSCGRQNPIIHLCIFPFGEAMTLDANYPQNVETGGEEPPPPLEHSDIDSDSAWLHFVMAFSVFPAASRLHYSSNSRNAFLFRWRRVHQRSRRPNPVARGGAQESWPRRQRHRARRGRLSPRKARPPSA